MNVESKDLSVFEFNETLSKWLADQTKVKQSLGGVNTDGLAMTRSASNGSAVDEDHSDAEDSNSDSDDDESNTLSVDYVTRDQFGNEIEIQGSTAKGRTIIAKFQLDSIFNVEKRPAPSDFQGFNAVELPATWFLKTTVVPSETHISTRFVYSIVNTLIARPNPTQPEPKITIIMLKSGRFAAGVFQVFPSLLPSLTHTTFDGLTRYDI